MTNRTLCSNCGRSLLGLADPAAVRFCPLCGAEWQSEASGSEDETHVGPSSQKTEWPAGGQAPPQTAATVQTEVQSPLQEGEEFAGYRILRCLGAGGMGAVYQVVRGANTLALKLIHPQIAGERAYLRRFQREAEFTIALSHPNIVRTISFAIERGRLLVVMEFLDGETLQARLRREGRLPLLDALQIMRDLARGLDYAHRNGVVHRDLKPSNILQTCAGVTKIADFGLMKEMGRIADLEGIPVRLQSSVFAHVVGVFQKILLEILEKEEADRPRDEKLQQLASQILAITFPSHPPAADPAPPAYFAELRGVACSTRSSMGLTRTGQLIGTPHYMAPEQCRGAPSDSRADLYALGVIFYEMLSGSLPIDGEDCLTVMTRKLTRRPALPPALRELIGPGIDRMISKLLDPDPEHRYPTAEFLLHDLERVIRGDSPIVETEKLLAALVAEGTREREQEHLDEYFFFYGLLDEYLHKITFVPERK